MNNNTLYQIKNDDVTLYVEMSYKGTQFDYKGFTVEGDSNFYMPSLTKFNQINLDGRPCVDICDYLFDKYKALADAQLLEHLERHILDTLSPEDFNDFWQQAGQQPTFKHSKELREKQVIDGLVGIEINRAVCFYNFAAHEPAGYRALFQDKELATTPMRVFYGDHLKQLLALEQYKRGLAPPMYTELARLNAFLEGKKSVKLVMKDSAVHEFKPNYDLFVSGLLDYWPECKTPFRLKNAYHLKPGFGSSRSLTDLDYLQFGKQQFAIDTDALGRFTREEAAAV